MIVSSGGLTSMSKGEVVGIYVQCNVANVWLVVIDVNLVAWIAGVLDMHMYGYGPWQYTSFDQVGDDG